MLDHEWLAKSLTERLRHEMRGRVGHAARRKRHDDPDGSLRPVLRMRGADRREREQRPKQGRQQVSRSHHGIPDRPSRVRTDGTRAD